jgi:hypothetical protein
VSRAFSGVKGTLTSRATVAFTPEDAEATGRSGGYGRVVDVLGLRMAALLLREHPGLAGRRPHDVPGVVEWFGAMQAQDLASGLWSLGARLPGQTSTEVVAALERAEVVRTWPMRGTLHLVPGRDARWMVELMAGRVSAAARTRRAQLGLSDADSERGVDLLAAALAGGARLTRAQCLGALDGAGLSTRGQRGYHLLGHAAQRGVICLAPNLGTEQSFVLLDDWAPGQHELGRDLDRDEALATICVRYLRSHGPTTRADLVGWTGLTVADVKRGIEVGLSRGEFGVRTVDGLELYADPALLHGADDTPWDDGLLVLPGFDEYLLGYKDRSLMLAPEHFQAVVPGGNGVFQSTVVRRGRVVATWKRTTSATSVVIDVRALPALDQPLLDEDLERAFDRYGAFVALPVRIRRRGSA